MRPVEESRSRFALARSRCRRAASCAQTGTAVVGAARHAVAARPALPAVRRGRPLVPAAQGDLMPATRAAITRTLVLAGVAGMVAVPAAWIAVLWARTRWFGEASSSPFDMLEAWAASLVGPFVGLFAGLVVGWLAVVVRHGRERRGALAAAADAPATDGAPAVVWLAWGLAATAAFVAFTTVFGGAVVVALAFATALGSSG